MAFAPPPLQPSSLYNPTNFVKESKDFIDKNNGTGYNNVLVNPRLTGNVTGIGGAPEFDSLKRKVDDAELDSAVLSDKVEQTMKSIKFEASPSNWKTFKSDTTLYLDFSEPANLGKDVSGYNRHAQNRNAVKYVADPTRTHAADFDTDISVSDGVLANYRRNLKCFDLSEHRVALLTQAFTYACNVKLLSAPRFQGYILGCTGSKRTLIYATAARLISFALPGLIITTSIALDLNVWYHLTVTNGAAGMKIYINGVQRATYSPGVNMASPFQTDNFVIGGQPQTGTPGEELRINYPFTGQVSDFIAFSRQLPQSDVAKLATDDYGSTIVMLGGQSNMLGAAPVELGIDDDYSLIAGRVFQYPVSSNLTWPAGTTPTVVATTILPATNPLRHPLITTASTSTTGLWLGFCNALCQNMDIAWRRKILLVPMAIGSTSFGAATGNYWKAGGTLPAGWLYQALIVATNHALSFNSFNSLGAFLWNQGESDISAINTNYASDFTALLDGFQANITGFSKTLTPIIIGEIVPSNYEGFSSGTTPASMISHLREAMIAMCNANPNMRFVKTADLDQRDIHWLAPALRTLGARYFEQLASIVGVRTNEVLTLDYATGVAKFDGVIQGGGIALETDVLELDTRIDTLETNVLELAPIQSPQFTGNPVVRAGWFGLGAVATGTNPWQAAPTADNVYSSICSNLYAMGELAFCQHRVLGGDSYAFVWVRFTAPNTKIRLMSLSYSGNLDVPGPMTVGGALAGPTITSLQTQLDDVNDRVDAITGEESRYLPLSSSATPYTLAAADVGKNIFVTFVSDQDLVINLPAPTIATRGKTFTICCSSAVYDKRVTLNITNGIRTNGMAVSTFALDTFTFPTCQSFFTVSVGFNNYFLH